MLGLQRGTVTLVPYDRDWPRLFNDEKAIILEAVRNRVDGICHIGSTSIPGLCAKPILDMGGIVYSREAARACVSPLAALGYEYRGAANIAGRHFFVKGNPSTHHLHLFEPQSEAWNDIIAFRDYLLCHPALVAEYACVKHELGRQFADDRVCYQEAKSLFIRKVLGRIRAAESRSRLGE